MRTIIPSLAMAVVFATGLAAQNVPGESIPSPQQPQVNAPAQQQPPGPVTGESQPSAQPPKLVRVPLPGETGSDVQSPVIPIPEGVTRTDQGAGPASGSNAVPAAQRTAFGNSNNNIPFSWTPTRYQQVFLGSELPNALAIQGMALRQDNQFSNFVGRVIDVEIYMGYSTFDQNTLTTTFATNYNAGPRTLVYARKMYKLPNMGPAPTDPNVFFAKIPFDNVFNYAPAAGRNVLVEVVVHGNDNGNLSFTFPLDAHSPTTTTRLFNTTSPTAPTGTLGVGFGLVLTFLTEPVTKDALPASLAHDFGNSNNNIPFSWTPTRYQQVFRGNELPNPSILNSVSVRQDNQFGNLTGNTIDVEMFIGETTFTEATLTTTFATNYSSPRTNIFNRRIVSLPNMGPAPTSPSTFFLKFNFDNPWPWTPAANKNLLWEVVVHGNGNGNLSFTYPLDAHSGGGVTTTRLFNAGNPTAPTGTLGLNYGLVACFNDQGDRFCITLPDELTSMFGSSNNNIPFSWSPTRYQQVFLDTDVPRSMNMITLGLRQDNQFSGFTGRTVDLEIRLARTTRTPATLTNTFATNLDAGAPTTVLPRQNVSLPNFPATLPSNPNAFFVQIPFATPYGYNKTSSNNFLVDVTNRGNSNGNLSFTYPLDADAGPGTSRLWSAAPTDLTGTLGLNSGLVMCFTEATTQANYTLFGNACVGSGPVPTTVPAAAAAAFGNSNNNIPFSWTPILYQQVFDGLELPATASICALGLRQDEAFGNWVGYNVNARIDLGHTSFTPATLTTTFASHFDRPGRQTVFNGVLNLPDMPRPLPTNARQFFLQIPFLANFPYTRATGNMLVEIDQTGNTNANTSFTYPLDAVSGANTTRLYGAAPTGTLGANYGLVMSFMQGSGGAPYLVNDGNPVIGRTHRINLFNARRSSSAFFVLGVSNTTWGAIPLPFNLAAINAPGCFLHSSAELILPPIGTNACGMAGLNIAVPNNLEWEGIVLFNQWIVFDPAANPLGLTTSNGGRALLGGF